MKVYVSGPYSNDDPAVVEKNVLAAIDASLDLWEAGHVPVCPHVSHWMGLRAAERGMKISWEDWIAYDFMFLIDCEAMVVLGDSPGVKAEILFAERNGIPVYKGLENFRNNLCMAMSN